MEYEVKLVPVDKAVVTPSGFFQPLCNNCASPDCSNPIKEMTISIAGKVQKNRLWIEQSGFIRQVVSCKGYVPDEPPISMGTKKN